jgi:hypothetical protein
MKGCPNLGCALRLISNKESSSVIFKKLRSRGARIVAATVFVLTVVAPASASIQATPAQAASACAAISTNSGDNGWEVPYNCESVLIPGSHVCGWFGWEQSYNEFADDCADIYAQNTSGRQQVWGVGEFYCQPTWTQCAGMNVTVDMSWTLGSLEAATTAPAHYKCNPNPGPACPGGRKLVSTTRGDIPQGSCATTHSWDPYDGWNGNPQVIAMKPNGLAAHSVATLVSNNVVVCFESS